MSKKGSEDVNNGLQKGLLQQWPWVTTVYSRRPYFLVFLEKYDDINGVRQQRSTKKRPTSYSRLYSCLVQVADRDKRQRTTCRREAVMCHVVAVTLTKNLKTEREGKKEKA